jgi:hypothetical protein
MSATKVPQVFAAWFDSEKGRQNVESAIPRRQESTLELELASKTGETDPIDVWETESHQPASTQSTDRGTAICKGGPRTKN